MHDHLCDPFDEVTLRVEYTPSHVSFYTRLAAEVEEFTQAVLDEHPNAIVEVVK